MAVLAFSLLASAALAAAYDAWTPQISGTTQTLYGVALSGAQTGWAVGAGGTIRHTSNAGATWVAQSSGTTQTLHSVVFADAETGWAVGAGGVILHTTNGGE